MVYGTESGPRVNYVWGRY